MKRIIQVLLIVLLVMWAWRSDAATTITGVIDGDAIEVTTGRQVEFVRLLGVLAPELGRPTPLTSECGANTAVDQLSMFLDSPVRLVRKGVDRHGYVLAYVHLATKSARVKNAWPRFPALSVNAYMVANGYARADRRFPHAFMDSYVRLETTARFNRWGLWLRCDNRP